MYEYPIHYDVLVVGAGHAGIEAAAAAARMGCHSLMLTQNLDTVGQMSCNPAVGGLAKGHMVREIDAMGGLIGLNTDATAIQCRMLNASKGPSVRGLRSQCDKKAYQFRMKFVCENYPNLDMQQGNAIRFLVENDRVCGVETLLGVRYRAKAVILTTGTFMRGLVHVGKQNQAGGRMGDGISTISDSLRELGFEILRFKTGTPCRLNKRSIDFSQLVPQYGDDPAPYFTHWPERLDFGKEQLFTLNRWEDGMFHVEQIPCWMTQTNEKTHEIIQANLTKSPMYSGQIEGVGPRYCPSIEDKVVRFSDKHSHQMFLEPEGKHTNEFYVNGLSTSLPLEVQLEMIHSVAGLENAEVIRAGYAIEYDCCPPTQLYPTLETKRIEGLFFAGQVNGTSGYEEAAAQGIMAGINAALKVQQKDPFILKRSEAYIGVLIDDLVTKGTQEPYRMFTSRAEHRLILRQDNADVRLTQKARELGLIEDTLWNMHTQKMESLNHLRAQVSLVRHDGLRLDQWLRRPENEWQKLPAEIRQMVQPVIWDQVATDIRYEGYVKRQEESIARAARFETKPIPEGIDYHKIRGLRAETQQKLANILPCTLGQASRVSGVTPADVALLAVWLERAHQQGTDLVAS